MDTLLTGIEAVLIGVCCVYGGGQIVQGGMLYSEGKGQTSSTKQDEGMGKIWGGIGIIIIASSLIAIIFTYAKSLMGG